jgi:hypothetical protein
MCKTLGTGQFLCPVACWMWVQAMNLFYAIVKLILKWQGWSSSTVCLWNLSVLMPPWTVCLWKWEFEREWIRTWKQEIWNECPGKDMKTNYFCSQCFKFLGVYCDQRLREHMNYQYWTENKMNLESQILTMRLVKWKTIKITILCKLTVCHSAII